MTTKNFLPRLMTIVNTEETVAGQVNPENKSQESTNNESKAKADEPNIRLSANGKEVELSPELLATVLSFLRGGIKTKMRTLVSYQDSKNDLKLVFVKGNRNVYGAQIDKLLRDVSARPIKKFFRSCVVVNAKAILEFNLTIPEEEKSKRVQLVDIHGNEVTLATPGIENYWAVIDGQHRVMVCMLHPEVDLDLELMDYSGDIMDLIKLYNSTDLNWRLPDYYRSNVETGKVSNGLLKKMEEIKAVIKCSDKVASYLCTFKRDAFKKSECIKGEDNSGYTPEKGERGLRIAKALRYKFGEETIKVELIDAVASAYGSLEDGSHSGLADTMVGFLAELSESTKRTIVSKMSTADYGVVKNTLEEGFKKYYEAHKEDITEHIVEVEKVINKSIPAPDSTKKAEEELKDGFPGDILKQRLAKTIKATEKKVESLTKQESSCLTSLGNLKAKKKLTDKESERLADTEARLSEIQSSIVVAKANIEDLKIQLAVFDKAA